MGRVLCPEVHRRGTTVDIPLRPGSPAPHPLPLDRWARHSPQPGLTVEALAPEEFTSRLRECEASGAFDHICIDLPGTREVTLFKVLARSDLVIIPAQASAPETPSAHARSSHDTGSLCVTSTSSARSARASSASPRRSLVTSRVYDLIE